MDNIVEAALRHARRSTSNEASEEERATEFEPPSFSLVGCGPTGTARIANGTTFRSGIGFADTRVEFDVTTIALCRSPLLAMSDVDEVIPTQVSSTPTDSDELPGTTPAEFESRLQAELPDCEIAIVTTHLTEPATGRLAAVAARSFPPETTVLTMPTVPPDGLSQDSEDAFQELVKTAGTTIPVDLSRVHDAFGHVTRMPAASTEEALLDVAGAVVKDLIRDLFMLVQAPLSAPVDRQRVHALLSSGGVALPYWGWRTRETEPAALLADATTHRLCDGNPATIDGGLGFLRFGTPFTLIEYEEIHALIAETFGTSDTETNRWVTGGQVTQGLGEECRLALLLMGADPKSLPFLCESV